MKKHFFFTIPLMMGALVIVAIFRFTPSLISPLPVSNELKTNPQSPRTYRVFAFLPYWNLSSKLSLPQETLTDIAYFSLEPDINGSFHPDLKQDTTDRGTVKWPEVKKLIPQIKQQGIKFHVVVKLFDTAILTNVLTHQEAQTAFIDSARELVTTDMVEGINLDLEPDKPLDFFVTQKLPGFLKLLRQSLDNTRPGIEISLDLSPRHAGGLSGLPIFEMVDFLDYLIIMGYDYHVQNSTISGPVSPLYGAQSGIVSSDLISDVKQITRKVPRDKIILAIPFYGYEWQTVDESLNSPTYPSSGAVASHSRIQELLKQKDVTQVWQQASMTPSLIINHNGVVSQVHYENERSLGYKCDLVSQADLLGLGIWAMGYESSSQSMWQVIRSKLPIR